MTPEPLDAELRAAKKREKENQYVAAAMFAILGAWAGYRLHGLGGAILGAMLGGIFGAFLPYVILALVAALIFGLVFFAGDWLRSVINQLWDVRF